jgi:hypothetical protein
MRHHGKPPRDLGLSCAVTASDAERPRFEPVIGPAVCQHDIGCQSAFKFGSDAISMMFTAAQVAPINLA